MDTTHASVLHQHRPVGGRGSLATISLAALVAFGFFVAVALPYLLLDPAVLARYEPRRAWLLLHVAAGGVALLTQRRLRKLEPRSGPVEYRAFTFIVGRREINPDAILHGLAKSLGHAAQLGIRLKKRLDQCSKCRRSPLLQSTREAGRPCASEDTQNRSPGYLRHPSGQAEVLTCRP
jgi:hypothetical protein